MKKLIVVTILLISAACASLISLIIKKMDGKDYEKVRYSVSAGITREVDNTEDDDDEIERNARESGLYDDNCDEKENKLVDLGIRKA